MKKLLVGLFWRERFTLWDLAALAVGSLMGEAYGFDSGFIAFVVLMVGGEWAGGFFKAWADSEGLG